MGTRFFAPFHTYYFAPFALLKPEEERKGKGEVIFMENWILTAVALQPKLPLAARMYTKRAESQALNMKDSAADVAARIVELNDIKRRIVNLRVLYKRMEESLSADEMSLIKRYVRSSCAEIAAETGVGRVRVYRSVKRALAKAVRVFARFGFGAKRMKEEYGTILLCAKVFDRIKRLKRFSRDTVGSAARIPDAPPCSAYVSA